MSHPFGDLLAQYRARKHGLSQAKLAEAVGYDHAVIVRMCQGKKDLTGPSGRDRVVRIIGALRDFGALSTSDEANALLEAANLPPLYAGQSTEAALIQSLNGRGTPHPAPAQHISHLPIPSTPLIGRENDIAFAKQCLMRDDVRLLTLLGPPGVGKTRLSLQIATELSDGFMDGACFVALAPMNDASFVIPTIAQALGVIQTPSQPFIESVKVALRSRHLLLVLDNFEHVLDATPHVAELLTTAPHLKILATSRAALRLSGEREFHVPPLALPDRDQLPPIADLLSFAAIDLFTQRAQAFQPDFALTDANAAAVVAICHRLSGLPLAIELAVARLKLFSPEALLARLEKSPLEMLTGGVSDLPPRQRMLRSTIDWSYSLLNAEEQRLFRRLGVFAGGFTLEAAEAVADAHWPMLSSLLDKSLVQRSHVSANGARADEARFTLLEMLREHAMENLVQSGEADEIRRRHAEYVVGLAEAAEPKLLTGEQIAWLIRLNSEHANLRAVLHWAQEHGDSETALRIIGATWRYWQTGTRLGEGRLWLGPTLSSESAARLPAAVLAKAYHAAGALAIRQGDTPEARRLHAQGARWAHEAKDDALIGLTLGGLTAANIELGELANARLILDRLLTHTRETKHWWNYAVALCFQGWLASLQGDYRSALALIGEGKAILLELGDRHLAMGPAMSGMGRAAELAGDSDQAKRHFIEGLRIEKELGNEFAEYQSVSEHLSGLGRLAATRRHPWHMARLCGAVEGLAERVGGIPREVVGQMDQQTAIAHYNKATGELVDEKVFAAAWAEGRAMTLEQAIEYTLADEHPLFHHHATG